MNINPKFWILLATVPWKGFSVLHRKLFPGVEQPTRGVLLMVTEQSLRLLGLRGAGEGDASLREEMLHLKLVL